VVVSFINVVNGFMIMLSELMTLLFCGLFLVSKAAMRLF